MQKKRFGGSIKLKQKETVHLQGDGMIIAPGLKSVYKEKGV
jgi:hypothetical protein